MHSTHPAGDTLAILIENRPEFLILCRTAKNAGYYYVGVSNRLTASEASYIVMNSGSRLLVGSAATQSMVEEIRSDLGDPPHAR